MSNVRYIILGLRTRSGPVTRVSSAWLLDIMGLSNQALSLAASRPLLAVFEARPISIKLFAGLS